MIKALIKKELLQFLSIYTFDRGKGKKRSAAASAAFLLILGFSFLSLSVMFFGSYMLLAEPIAAAGSDWMLFSMTGAVTLTIGVIGSVFTTYAMLYKAKDNELLLSMPIPPRVIILVRMATVFLTSLVSCAIAWTPSLAAYVINMGFSPTVLFSHVLMLFVLTALVTVVTSVLGWLIALVSRFFRNKSLVTVVLSLVFIAGYFVFYSRMNRIINTVIANLDKIEAAMHGWGWPLMQIGRAANGEILPLALIILLAAGLFALMYFVLSKTLFSVLTSTGKVKKAVYREKRARLGSVGSALLKREFAHFLSCPTLILNTGLGALMVVAGAIAAVIKAPAIRDFLAGFGFTGILSYAVRLLPMLLVSLVVSMDCFTSSSVSLEGKRIWLIQTMPVPAAKVLRVKELTHFLINGVPAVIASVALCFVVRCSVAETVLSAVGSLVFIWMTAAFGLMMNLIKPNLEWTNESVPIKQGLPVLFSMLFGAGSVFVSAIASMGLASLVGTWPAMLLLSAVWAAEAAVFDLWIRKKGSLKFSFLN